jgi:hypothetical protein
MARTVRSARGRWGASDHAIAVPDAALSREQLASYKPQPLPLRFLLRRYMPQSRMKKWIPAYPWLP